MTTFSLIVSPAPTPVWYVQMVSDHQCLTLFIVYVKFHRVAE